MGREPGYADAWAMLAFAHLDAARYGLVEPAAKARRDGGRRGGGAARGGAGAGPGAALAGAGGAALRERRLRRGRAGAAARDRAQPRQPGEPGAARLAADGAGALGRGRHATCRTRSTAASACPVWYYSTLASALYLKGDVAGALDAAELGKGDCCGIGYAVLAIAEAAAGHPAEARADLDEAAAAGARPGARPAGVLGQSPALGRGHRPARRGPGPGGARGGAVGGARPGEPVIGAALSAFGFERARITMRAARLFALAAIVCALVLATSGTRAVAEASDGYVGTAACAGCHAAETTAWRGSHHDLAMEEATPATVLGDFGDATFTYGSVTSRFFTRDGRYLVNTDGTDGRLADFEIRYTFGVYPLQQYLIAFPDGRLQALGIAWDARPKEQGGQRWFHLYPGEDVHAGETIHWTGRDQTWNYACAECHSTNLRKNYDPASDSYRTSWSEIDVACESCHGPGAAHVAWAGKAGASGPGGDDGLTVHFNERQGVHWAADPQTGKPARSRPRTTAVELETCGMCHARRTQLHEPWRPGRQLLDTHLTSLLEPGLFEADGKMVGEVYNYQAFRQSKMFSRGVTCSDCHDPHSLKLRAEGNAVCTQCHQAATYDTAAHHHHAEGTPAGQCASCHMPERTYMVVDRRHDHGFRVPRPDLSVRFGVTNTCNDCHADQTPTWAADAVERWYGPEREGFQTWTPAFDAVRRGAPEAGELLRQLAAADSTPSVARATALEELGPYLTEATVPAFTTALKDSDPLVRLGALRGLRPLPPQAAWQLASPLLDDPVRGVRIEAAGLLADVPAAAARPGRPRAPRPGGGGLRRGAAAGRRPAGGADEPRQLPRPPRPAVGSRAGVPGRHQARAGLPAGLRRSRRPVRAAAA